MVSLSFEKFRLSNGLEVILHQDHAIPLVAVNLWYHVGSRDERPGKTGFAHLFEHLMFEGSKNHNRGYFDSLQEVGATLNGSTNTDRTNYWENVPSNYLELALWLEADRMGYLLDALDESRFNIQREVVKNERRQSYENRPYGMARMWLQEALYPLPHPYHWQTIGSQEDLEAATLQDAQEFFRRFYVPGNASLAIAGDIQLDEARRLVERYFTDVPPGAPLSRRRRWDTSFQGRANLTLFDRVQLPRLFLVWPAVARFSEDEAALALLAGVLGDGRSSRLYRALVYERQIAQNVDVYQFASELTGDFTIDVTAAAGHTAEELEAAVGQEVERLRQQPPTGEELARVKNRLEARRVRQLQNIGGFGGRADLLNAFNVFTGDPGRFNTDLQRYLRVQGDDVQRVAKAFLGERQVCLVVLPQPSLTPVAGVGLDRTVKPQAASVRPFTPPIPERHTLSNGLQLMVMERRELPVVGFGFLVEAGAVTDPLDRAGLASFTTAMLQEGTRTRSSQQIAEELEFLGASLNTRTGREQVLLATEMLARHWPRALELVADLVQHPIFPERELSRIRTERLTSLRRVKDDPVALAERIAPLLAYGREHPYGHPAAGTEDTVAGISGADVLQHFRRHYGPRRATLIVVGDVSLEEVVKQVEERLGGWQGDGTHPPPAGSPLASPVPVAPGVYLVDKPGAAQSVIRARHLGVPRLHPDYYALTLLNHLFGGQFTARLNQNLRESKGYSYGYRSWIEWHRHTSSLAAGGSVHTAVTREAVAETLREFRELRSERLPTGEEFQAAKANVLRQYPTLFETSSELLEMMAQMALFGLPGDYSRTYSQSIAAVSLEEVRRVAMERVNDQALTVLVVGDAQTVELGLRELGLPLVLLDDQGKELSGEG